MKKAIIAMSASLVIILIASQFVSIFVIQPIGALPEGRTVIITRLTKLHFIDSADAFCERETGGVSLLCRGMVAARVANQSTIIARLPYSSTLYGISTGGKFYDR